MCWQSAQGILLQDEWQLVGIHSSIQRWVVVGASNIQKQRLTFLLRYNNQLGRSSVFCQILLQNKEGIKELVIGMVVKGVVVYVSFGRLPWWW